MKLPSPNFLLHFKTRRLLAAGFLIITNLAHAQTSGTWTNATSNSTWGNTANWSGGSVASGADATADFSTLDITANRIVNLGANWTVGSLSFGDNTTASNNWTLASGTGGPWTLTLQTTTGTPTINVINQTTTISAALAGTQGFIKSGGGALALTGANTLSGGIALSAGTLNFASGALGSNLVTVTGNATLGWSGTNTQDISAQLKIEDGVTAILATGANNITLATPIQTGGLATASVTKTGAGTLTFTPVNTYTGTTRVSAGRLILTGGDDRLSAAGSILLGQGANGGVLQLGDASLAVNQTTRSLTIAGSSTSNAVIGGNAAVSTLTINNSTAVTYAGRLGGTGANENNLALAKTGSGVLTLSNTSNSFTGGITLSQGTLSFADGALAANLITFNSGATLQWATGSTSDVTTSGGLLISDGVTATLDTNGNGITLASPIQTGPLATGALIKSNTGTLLITAANTYTGGTTVRNGTVILAGGDNRLAATGAVTMGNGSNTNVTLQLGDANGASNQTISSIATAGTGTNFIKGGNAAISTLTINNSAARTFSGTLGSGLPGATGVEENIALVKTGAGSLTLSGAANSFVGDVTVSGGALITRNSDSLGSGTKTITIVGATNTPSLHLDGTAGNIVFASALSFVTSNQNAASPAILNTAGDNIINGTISPTNGGAGAGGTRIRVNAGSLTLNGGIAPAATATSARVLTLDGAGNGIVNGAIANNGVTLSLIKDGVGTWTLTNANTFTGNVTIINGTMQVDNTTGSGTGTGTVTVQTGAKLQGSGTIGGITTVQSGAFLEAGTSTITGAITFENRLNLLDGSTTDFHLASSSLYDQVIAQNFSVGTTSSSTALFRIFLFGGYSPVEGDTFHLLDWTTLIPGGDSDLSDNLDLSAAVLGAGLDWDRSQFHSNGILSVTALVPEPSRTLLAMLGLAFALARRRRSRW